MPESLERRRSRERAYRRRFDAPTGSHRGANDTKAVPMELGAFSVSLSVQDIAASRAFYEKLGFLPVMGDADQGWLIMRNARTTIGLFQGMLERNTLTFNPGWDAEANELGSFTDIRDIQRQLRAAGLQLDSEVDEPGRGPGSLVLHDPDGNPIFIDQHV